VDNVNIISINNEAFRKSKLNKNLSYSPATILSARAISLTSFKEIQAIFIVATHAIN